MSESEWKKGLYYLGMKELEDWLPWKAANIRRLIRTGKIKGKKIKGYWLVRIKDLYKFLGQKYEDME
ncbi:unnamed protein product [marine sediment metagenome]|uniref:Helix-turn-helix domain-containing protein n=1 Tax=marine sediment metagenome TaxID=412755 RepID=X1V4A5_9ZZZZ